MKTIIIKEINMVSTNGEEVSEYLIYLMENDVKLSCYNVVGDESKNKIVGELLEKNSNNTSILEINLEEFLKINENNG
jgi:hypothetical protein